MVAPSTLQALIRGSDTSFRSSQDRLAFAVHAWHLAVGFKLIAVGEAVSRASELPKDAPEVSVEGWNAEQDSFAFAYAHHLAGQPGVRVKCVKQGAKLLVTASGGASPPRVLELELDAFVDPATAGSAQGFKNMAQLTSLLDASLQPQHAQPADARPSQQQQRSSPTSSRQDAKPRPAPPSLEEPSPGFSGREPSQPGYYPQPGHPGLREPGLPVGAHDIVPPGFRPPGMPSGGFAGLMDPSRGGGMHMGFDDPAFGGGVSGRPRPGMQPGGARWDPIAPPGMQGFHPDDFQRDRRGGGQGPPVHPDMMQPGPTGRFDDSMFS